MNRERHIVPLISDYIDGCLAPALMRQVAEHLAWCSPCARELEQWRAVLRLVAQHAQRSCPIDCAEAVMRRVEDGAAPGSARDGREESPVFDLGFRIPDWKGVSGSWPDPNSKIQNPTSSGLAWLTAVVAIGVLLGGWRWASVTGSPNSIARHEAQGMNGARDPALAGSNTYAIAPRHLETVAVETPDRLERAFGRSDSLILASDFAEEER